MRLNFITLTAAAALCIPAAVLAEAPKSSSAPSAKPATTPQSTAPGQTGTTPGQSQATPGQASDLTPAVTGETPSGQTTAKGQATADTKPAKAEVKAGASVYDAKGQLVGKIDSVDGKSAVLNTGKV